MKRYNSTIIQKKCKCSPDCNLYPTMGFKGYNNKHFPNEINETKKETKIKTKSDYLKLADILFSKFIKNRDSDSNGNIQCVCCYKTYNLKDKDSSGNYIVNNLHFVQRNVYSLRFSEINCHAGCSVCNLDMHLNPEGLAYKRFKQYLIDAVGEEEVNEMELQKREINKLSEFELKTIIEKYKKQKL